ncbi:hypothetical protein BV20DRAFT_974411 [Pilatotrama ljubarskyi]|nr:hypothetical protein BV20DRAFT_974411 [Pilatotrama ljubarskyi]
MPPVALNDDVLRHVVSFLHGRDALQVALCSKHMSDLALPRVAAIAICESPRDLRETWKYMLSGTPPRVQYLEELYISYFTFDYPAQDAEAAQQLFSDYWHFSDVSLIGDLLLQAPRMRRVTLERLHPCLRVDPRIGQALASMDRLVAADFSTVADSTFALMPPMNENLRRLRLWYFWDEDDHLPGETKTLPPLLTTLGRYRHLHTLELWNLDPPADGVRQYFSADTMPSLSSIRNLKFHMVSVGALELVEFCPNLLSVDFALAQDEPVANLPDGPQWPHLRRLTLSTFRVIPSLLNRLQTVDQLQITDTLEMGEENAENEEDEEDNVTELLKLIERTSPIGMSLSVASESAPTMFWSRVAALAPRLRSMQLTVLLVGLSLANKYWLDALPDALRPLPLMHLSLGIPRAYDVSKPPPLGESEVSDSPAADGRLDADTSEVEWQLAETIAALPAGLAAAIPTLRLLSMTSALHYRDILEGPARPDDELHRRFRRSESRFGDDTMDVRYWRIVVDGQQRYVKEVSAISEEAERMRALAVAVGRGDALVGLIDRLLSPL